MPSQIEILGVRVDDITQAELQREICALVDGGAHTYLSYVNVHAILIAQSDPEFRRFVNSSQQVYCDGEGVRLGALILGHHLPPRIVLTYWIWDLCALCEERGYSVFLLGGRPGSADDSADNLRRRFPQLRISGTCHGYFEKAGSETDDVVRQVNEAKPDILFVCFGMPLQEYWVQQNLPRLNAKVVLFGGSTIEYTAGRRKTAPRWMSRTGFEWLYRFLQEPRRLWRRYLIGNPVFVLSVLRQRLRQRRWQ